MGEFIHSFFMNGNLEPDERVLDDSVRYPGGMLGQLVDQVCLGYTL